MWTTTDRLMEGAAEGHGGRAQSGISLASAISCVGRRLVLGAPDWRELRLGRGRAGSRAPIVGFYATVRFLPMALRVATRP